MNRMQKHVKTQPPAADLLRQISALAYDTSKAAEDRIREIQELWEGASQPPSAGQVEARHRMDGYNAGWAAHQRASQPPEVHHSTTDVCDRLERLAGDVLHTYGVEISNLTDELIQFYRRGGDTSPTKSGDAPPTEYVMKPSEAASFDKVRRKHIVGHAQPAGDGHQVVRALLALIDRIAPPSTIDPAITDALSYLRGDSGQTKSGDAP